MRRASPVSRKWFDGKQSAATSTRLPRKAPSGSAVISICSPEVTFSQVVTVSAGALIMARHCATNAARLPKA